MQVIIRYKINVIIVIESFIMSYSKMSADNHVVDNSNSKILETNHLSYQKKKNIKRKKTNASKSSKHVTQRSKATTGINKDIHLDLPSATNVSQEDVMKMLYTTDCNCASSSAKNCFLRCIPTYQGIKDINTLANIIMFCQNITVTKTKDEKEAFLLRTTKDSISATTSKSCTSSSKRPRTINENDIMCFMTTTTASSDENLKVNKFKFNLPTNLEGVSSSLTFENTQICRPMFLKLYRFNEYELKKASQRLKENPMAESFHKEKFTDNHLHPYNHTECETIFENNLKWQNDATRNYDDTMISDSMLPVAESDIDVSLWLEDTFLTYGDAAPNRNIHQVSSTFKIDLFKKYVKDMTELKRGPVAESRFMELWNSCYPSYLIRPWANVCGKCDTCYMIDCGRRTANDKNTKEALRQAHLLHRGGLFMPERRRCVVFIRCIL